MFRKINRDTMTDHVNEIQALINTLVNTGDYKTETIAEYRGQQMMLNRIIKGSDISDGLYPRSDELNRNALAHLDVFSKVLKDTLTEMTDLDIAAYEKGAKEIVTNLLTSTDFVVSDDRLAVFDMEQINKEYESLKLEAELNPHLLSDYKHGIKSALESIIEGRYSIDETNEVCHWAIEDELQNEIRNDGEHTEGYLSVLQDIQDFKSPYLQTDPKPYSIEFFDDAHYGVLVTSHTSVNPSEYMTDIHNDIGYHSPYYNGRILFDITSMTGQDNPHREASVVNGKIDVLSFTTTDQDIALFKAQKNENTCDKFVLFKLTGPTAGTFVHPTYLHLSGEKYLDVGSFKDVSVNLIDATLLTIEECNEIGINPDDETKYIKIPMSQDFLNDFPFEMTDQQYMKRSTSPLIPTDAVEQVYHQLDPDTDFVILTPNGFMDEKYNPLDNTSAPKIRGFELNDANLYNANAIKATKNTNILIGNRIIVPISKNQQELLNGLDAFSKEKNPYGFFYEPIGQSQKHELNLETYPELLKIGDIPKPTQDTLADALVKLEDSKTTQMETNMV